MLGKIREIEGAIQGRLATDTILLPDVLPQQSRFAHASRSPYAKHRSLPIDVVDEVSHNPHIGGIEQGILFLK